MDEFTTFDEHFFRIHSAIETFGFFTMAVRATTTRPPWAYSIGFLEVGQPEVVVVGLHAGSAHQLICWAYHEMTHHGPVELGRQHTRPFVNGAGDELPLAVLPVPDVQWEHPSDLTLHMRVYYEARGGYPCEPRVCQVVWPDEDGRLPWDPGCDATVRAEQLLLDAAPWEEDRGECTCGPWCDMWEGQRNPTRPHRRRWHRR